MAEPTERDWLEATDAWRQRHPCPKGDDCALNDGAIHCLSCGRNWPPDETWDRGPEVSDGD